MSQTNINIRMDLELKKQFEKFCKETGLNMTTAFNIFAKAVVREQKIPFEITTESFYSKENLNHLRKSIENLNEGKGKEHDLIEDDD